MLRRLNKLGKKANPRTHLSRGNAAEALALKLLKQSGLKLRQRNYSVHNVGELDLVMFEPSSQTMVVIEVRFRQNDEFGGAAVTVSASKQQRIIRATEHLLQQHPEWHDCSWRFDVFCFDGDISEEHSQWIKAAFEAG